jgi:UDP-N-acetyl-D-galactosamine dehydrogenase
VCWCAKKHETYQMKLSETKISTIGLGYVGLPLALSFAENYKVIGFDVNDTRVKQLNTGHDCTLEIKAQILNSLLDCEISHLSIA